MSFGDLLSRGTKLAGDRLSRGTKLAGDCLSRGTEIFGTNCPGGPEVRGTRCPEGPNVWGPDVGDRMSGDHMRSGPNASQPTICVLNRCTKQGNLIKGLQNEARLCTATNNFSDINCIIFFA